jgi:hypothetical protein
VNPFVFQAVARCLVNLYPYAVKGFEQGVLLVVDVCEFLVKVEAFLGESDFQFGVTPPL